MMPIRRGDGTGLSVPGFSEVRTGDGTVLWSAGGDIPDSVVDNFEDGDISVLKSNWSGWNGDTGSLTAQQSVVLEGDYSGEHTASGGTFTDITASRDTAGSPSELKILARSDNPNGLNFDSPFQWTIFSGGVTVLQAKLRGDGDISINSDLVSGSWATSTTYQVRFYNIEWGNNQTDYEIVDQFDGSVIASGTDVAFNNGASDVDSILIRNDSNDGSGQTVYYDYFQWVQ